MWGPAAQGDVLPRLRLPLPGTPKRCHRLHDALHALFPPAHLWVCDRLPRELELFGRLTGRRFALLGVDADAAAAAA